MQRARDREREERIAFLLGFIVVCLLLMNIKGWDRREDY